MKILLLFYTKSGNTEKVANDIKSFFEKNNHQVDLKKIIDKKSRSGFFNYIKAGRDALKKYTTDIEEMQDLNLDAYNKIFIGSPIWAGKITPAVRTAIEKYKLKEKKPFYFLTANSVHFTKAIKDLNEEFQNTNKVFCFVKKEIFKDKKIYDKKIEEIEKFI